MAIGGRYAGMFRLQSGRFAVDDAPALGST
jgi:hypothetical protein